jgi:hypothetical protein
MPGLSACPKLATTVSFYIQFLTFKPCETVFIARLQEEVGNLWRAARGFIEPKIYVKSNAAAAAEDRGVP